MNWYKIAQEFTEWENHPDAHHDYDPSWDYEIDEVPDEQLVSITEDIMKEINENLMPEIGMGHAKVAYIKDAGEQTLARYAFGTAPYPVFVVNLEEIRDAAEQYGVNIGVGIETTLTHELGHAIQDWMGMELEEEQAEEFARQWYDFRQLYKFWE